MGKNRSREYMDRRNARKRAARAAANAWALNPGGRANQRVIRAVKKMPLCEVCKC